MSSITERDGKFLVRVSRKGYKRINKTFTTRRDAEVFAKAVEVDIERGAFKQDRGDKVVFRDLVIRYQKDITPGKRGHVEESGRIDYLLKSASVARPMLDMFVSDLKPHHIATWRDARLKQVAAATVVREWQLLSHVLSVARLDWGFAEIDSPFKGLRKPEIRDSRDRRISPEELNAICEATQSRELASFVRLAVETAARRGELLALAWRDIDLKRRVATLRQTKNGAVRVVPLSPAAVDLLSGLPRNFDGRVFTLRPDSVTQAFRRAVERARREYRGDDPEHLVGLRLHDARHEACSRLAERGWSTLEVAAVSGHKTLQLLRRYTHLRPEDLARKLEAG